MESNLSQRMINIKSQNEKLSLLDLINQEKNKLMKSNNKDDLVRHAILNFVEIYNPLSSEWKYKYVEEFTKSLALCYDKSQKDISKHIIKLMDDKFKAPSFFKIIINFNEKINQEKIHLECCLKLILLTKKLENLISGIKMYLNIDNELLLKNLEKFDFESPYAHILLRNIVEKLIKAETNINNKIVENLFIEQDNEIKQYYRFLCPKCLQIQFIRYFNNKLQIICPNLHDYSNNINNIDKLDSVINLVLKCNTCNEEIELYENNYYCLRCDKSFCPKCVEEHKNECIKFIICKIYDVSFMCKEHNKRYVSICYNRNCQKNLCDICKSNHYHKVSEKDLYNAKSIVTKYKSIVKNETEKNVKIYILKQLIFNYEFLENYYKIPLLLIQSLHFSIYNQDIKLNDSDYFFKELFDKDFIAYYSKLIDKMEKGNITANHILNGIKKIYFKEKMPINVVNYLMYSSAIPEVISNNHFKIRHLSILDSYINALNENIKDNILKYGYVSRIENDINNLGIKIELYKSKIISLFQTNRRYIQSLKLIFDRYFADLILRKIIKNYPSYFEPIEFDKKIDLTIKSYLKKRKENEIRIN